MSNNTKNKQKGFLKIIIIIVIALFLFKYFNITISDVFNWIKTLFNTVFN
ncbi:MAG: hypothetical protein WC839_01265 [Candidatus Paceibacterota bacterium]